MSDNNFDIDIYPTRNGWVVTVDYYFKNRRGNVTSKTSYTWKTSCRELIDWFQRRKTKVFYSQLRVLCRQFGEKERELYT